MTTTSSPKKDVYQIVTEHVIHSLEQGIIPWRVSWVTGGIPRNALSLKPYRGANVPLLSMHGFEKNLFISEVQLNNLGATIRENEKPLLASHLGFRLDKNGSGERVSVLTFYRIYNISQCEGISVEGEEMRPEMGNPLAVCKALVEGMPNVPTIEFKSQSAFYDSSSDVVHMPSSDEYTNPSLFYYDLFTLLVHATGHASRLDRKEFSEYEPFTMNPFSREALVADMAAHYLCFHAGITDRLLVPNMRHIYLWLEVLRDDARLFVFAATQAQKVVDFILGRDKVPETTEEGEEENEEPAPEDESEE